MATPSAAQIAYQHNAVRAAHAVLDCLAQELAGMSIYQTRADATFDAACQRDALAKAFPEAFAEAKS